MTRAVRLVLTVVVASACGPSLKQLQPLAAAGELQSDAPVKAEAHLDIDAPIERVWAVLADVERWPQWSADAQGAHLDGPFAAGTRFGYGSHRLQLACIEPPRELAYFGTVAGYQGITVWELAEISPGRTRATARESNDGFLISLFYPPAQLEQHLERWLDALKKAAER